MNAFLSVAILMSSEAEAGKRPPVQDAPIWMTDKDQVRIEIVEKLVDGGDAERALEIIRVMRTEGVERPELFLYQGAALRQLMLVDEAEQLLERAAKAMPRAGRPHRELCVLYADDGRPQEAIPACERAVKLSPEDASAWNNLGFLYLVAMNTPERARDALQRAVEIDSTSIKYRNNLGYAQVALGDHRSGLRTFMSTTTPADAHYQVGVAFERQGESRQALSYFRRAYSLDENHMPADEAIRRLGASLDESPLQGSQEEQ